jgi:hypothetical protein
MKAKLTARWVCAGVAYDWQHRQDVEEAALEGAT